MAVKELADYREEFPITRSYTFLNHAAIAPLPLRVAERVAGLFQEFSLCGIACYPQWMQRLAEVRRLFASLIKAQPDEVAFVANTSDGLSAVAAGLRWKAGDIVLIPRPEFPANVYPWLNLERRGVVIRFFERREGRFEVETVENALEAGTRLLAVSSVDFSTGFHCDLEALGDFCRRRGLLFCVDAIQSLGVIPLDVSKCNIHFLAAGSHKWLLGTMGSGGLFVSRAVSHLLHPVRVGWRSVVQEEEFSRLHFELKADARRLEAGTMNVAGIHALGAAIELLLEVGLERVRRKIFALNDILYQGLTQRGLQVVTSMEESERSGILSFVPLVDPASLHRFFTEKKVVLSLRDGKIRLAPHFYNNEEDVARFFEALDGFSGSC